MVLRRLAAVLTLALTGLTVFVLTTRDASRAEPAPVASAPPGADVHYAQMMVVHHEQAVRMSRALLAKGGVPERVRLIADFIAHDQQREIDDTRAWLAAWDLPAALAEPGGAEHGMLTEAQLAGLDRAAPGPAPDLFLTLMIEHHEGAITMSQSLLDAPGGNVWIRGLAKHVVNEQGAEIEAMTALIGPDVADS